MPNTLTSLPEKLGYSDEIDGVRQWTVKRLHEVGALATFGVEATGTVAHHSANLIIRGIRSLFGRNH